MAKIIVIVICLIAAFDGSLTSTNMECDYQTRGFMVIDYIYCCTVNNNPNITTEISAQITRINGTHKSSNGNDDVEGFYAQNKTINFFPKGLDKFFKNLKLITINTCNLKEIHQSDLKPFPKLVFLNILKNDIEVIEEGLFDFNPNLELTWLSESKIIHIDPNVFDHLTKLGYFSLSSVPCINKHIHNSRQVIQNAIKIVKTNCTSSEFLSLDNQIESYEIESKTLCSEALDLKFLKLQENFKSSKFLKFRPLSNKFEILKNRRCSNCHQLEKIIALDSKVDEICKNLEDLKVPLNELKSSQTTLNSIKSSTDVQQSKLDQIQNSQNQLKDSMSGSINNMFNKVSEIVSFHGAMQTSLSQIEVKANDHQNSSMNDFSLKISQLDSTQKKAAALIDELKTSQNDTIQVIRDLKLSQEFLKASQDSSLSNLTSIINNLKKDIKTTQDDTKLSINDIEVKLSDSKKFQAEVKDSFIKVRSMQNEIKMALNDLSVNKNDEFEGKFSDLTDKVEGFDSHFVDLKAKIDKNEKELTNKFHKMSTNFDDKIKGIEKRLMKKFEEIFEEKLVKIFNERLEKLINTRTGSE